MLSNGSTLHISLQSLPHLALRLRFLFLQSQKTTTGRLLLRRRNGRCPGCLADNGAPVVGARFTLALLAAGDGALGVDMAEQDALGELSLLDDLFDAGFEIGEHLLHWGGSQEGGEEDGGCDEDFIGCVGVVAVFNLEGEGRDSLERLPQICGDLVICDSEARRRENEAIEGLCIRRLR